MLNSGEHRNISKMINPIELGWKHSNCKLLAEPCTQQCPGSFSAATAQHRQTVKGTQHVRAHSWEGHTAWKDRECESGYISRPQQSVVRCQCSVRPTPACPTHSDNSSEASQPLQPANQHQITPTKWHSRWHRPTRAQSRQT